MTRYIINEEKLCEIYNSQSKTILKRVVKEILSHPYQSERDTCPQNKIWQHCPAAEQIRKQERDKVLDELERLLCAHHKYVGSYRVITGTPEEIYDELFDAMQALRQQAGES
jgi:uncharacterized protein (UPF0297 family)